MQKTIDLSSLQITQLTAINIAKVITIVCLISLAVFYGCHDLRQVLYLCLHISYCLWWLLEQWLFPQRRQHIFTEKVGISPLVFTLLFVGVFYAFPGYLAFINPHPIGYSSVAIALPLYIFGSLINTGADIQKMTAKTMGATLVSDGVWRLVRHPNYLGDLLRYTSFSVLSGSWWAFPFIGVIISLYLQLIPQREQAMATKYSEFAAYQQSTNRLIPRIW